MTSPQERQAQTSLGLRERLFETLDGVIAGTIKKEKVEAICFISQEILKSAEVDLRFEAMSQSKLKLQNELELQKQESIKLLTNTVDIISEPELSND